MIGVGGIHFHRMPLFRAVHDMRERGIARQGRDQHRLDRVAADEETAQAGGRQHDGGDGAAPAWRETGAATRGADQIEWQGLVQDRIEGRMQRPILFHPVVHPPGVLGMPRQPRLHLQAPRLVECGVRVGVQIVFVDRVHLTTLSFTAGASASRCRRRSRPRDRRDITVPSGTPRMCAVSA